MHGRSGVILVPLLACALGAAGVAPVPVVVSDFDGPPLFAYGAWEHGVAVADGAWRIAGDGVTTQGGAGSNCDLDLSSAPDGVLRLRVRPLPGNAATSLKVMLRDADGTAFTYLIALPAPAANEWVDLFASDGARLSQGHSATDQQGMVAGLDAAHIVQWQLQGDWAKAPLAVLVDQLALTAPDDAVRAARSAVLVRRQQEAEASARALAAARAALQRTDQSPVVSRVSLVAPDILAVEIDAGRVVHAGLRPYVAQPGDTRKDDVRNPGQRNEARTVKLVRGGSEVGWLIGPERNWLTPFEGFEGDPLLDVLADQVDSCNIASVEDVGYGRPRTPVRMYRKSKPQDWQMPGNAFAMRHTLYLALPQPLTSHRAYTVAFPGLNTRQSEITFTNAPERTRSEAVHGSQIGFRPDDPCKRAFLSIWLGTGGPHAYPEGLPFHLLDDTSGRTVFTGHAEISKRADAKEQMRYEMNWNKTDVLRLDFSAFGSPGRYRVFVEGIGCGYPFEIGDGVWQAAFQVQMQGFYNNRSGIALGAPYSTFTRPRALHLDDGQVAYQSTATYCEVGDDTSRLADGDTGQPVPEAWGGYHDAGDWNPRRVTHLRAALLQLELLDLFPAYFAKLALSIPKTAVAAPDLLNECLFELDLFRRLQKPDGGVPFGIETEGDPIDGEVSWLQSMRQYVYAPDCYASFYYAIVAARASRILTRHDPELAATYRVSAQRAAEWGELDFQRRKDRAQPGSRLRDAATFRSFAALELYRLTGDAAWHARFLEETPLRDAQLVPFEKGGLHLQDAVFAYACLPAELADPECQRNAVAATAREADLSLDYARGNAFNLTHWHKPMPMFIGFYSVPGAQQLVRAHALTGSPAYLYGAVQATLFPSGANPNNMTYTSGLGCNPPRHVLNLDARHTGQPSPAGITPYGNCDYAHFQDNGFFTWPVQWFLSRDCRPSAWDWPIPEAYFDIFRFAGQNEPTMDQTMGPNAYVWGYLAARR